MGCALLAAQTGTWSVPESMGQASQPVEGGLLRQGPSHGRVWYSLPGSEPGAGIRWLLLWK